MNFVMNGRTWKIVELSQDKIREEYKKYKYDGEPEQGKYFGLTYFDSQTIYVDADLHIQQKKQTLRHELMHCYLGCYVGVRHMIVSMKRTYVIFFLLHMTLFKVL